MIRKFVERMKEFVMKNLRKQFNKSIFLIFLCGILFQISAQTDKRIENIKKIYSETNQKITETNENGEFSSVFLAELVVNKNNGSYPAVGLFQTTYKFYYTYGDREKNPYPNRLLKIEIETKRSAIIEKYEFLFDEKEQLIFYFGGKNEAEKLIEKRIYFQNETPIKSLLGEKIFTNIETIKLSKTALREKKKLAAMFQNALNY